MKKIGLLGSTGRMGKWVTQLLTEEYASRAILSAEAGLGKSLSPLLEVDVIIDFSSPAAVAELIALAQKHPKPLPAFVIGSTGLSGSEQESLKSLASKTRVLTASNFSTGVLCVTEILRMISPALKKLGYTPVITESHHIHKKDSPSGTAITLQKAISPKSPDQIQTHAIRAGEVIGEHQVTFYGPGDEITISHSAKNRSLFARGAIDVALWLSNQKKPGNYSIDDFFKEISV